MLLGFRRRFAPFIEDGSKRHTMRPKRKRRPVVGETCHCYVDPRQKSMRLLGRWPCVKVEDVLIYQCGDGTLSMLIEGTEMSMDEKNYFAWADGFRSRGRHLAWEELSEFWLDAHGKSEESLEFEGDIIHWSYA